MNVPTGYTELDLIGYTDKGAYSAAAAYVKNDIVHYQDNLWRCLIDDTTGITPAEGQSWTIFIQSSGTFSGLTATDTSGIVGQAGATVNAQTLTDALAEGVADSSDISGCLKVVNGKLCMAYETE